MNKITNIIKATNVLGLAIFVILLLPLKSHSQTESNFQQQANYKIYVRLDDETHFLHGTEFVEYTNNSNQSLQEIYFQLFPNAYQDNETPLAKQLLNQKNFALEFGSYEDIGFIDSLDFYINNEQVNIEYDEENIEICKIILKEPLAPNKKIKISTTFRVKIPSGEISKFGHFGQSYQILHWYPKVAVYNDCGWQLFSYLDQSDFYGDFGTYDVFVTLPNNYIVASSGKLIENEEEYNWLSLLAQQTEETDDFDYDMQEPPSSKEFKTLRFYQENIHDFAWFADKRFNVLKKTVRIPGNNEKITLWAFFTDEEAALWENSTNFMFDALKIYTEWLGEFPYNQFTIVQSPFMNKTVIETPLMSILGKTNTPLTFESTIASSISKNWFYSSITMHENKNAWLNHGLSSFYELRYVNKKYPNNKMLSIFNLPGLNSTVFNLDDYHYMDYYYLGYLFPSRKNIDQPIITPSDEMIPLNYSSVGYYKNGLIFNYLYNYIGEKEFDENIQQFCKLYKYKTVEPFELQYILEESTSKNLNWFFYDLVQTSAKIDYSIKSIEKVDKGYVLTMKNKGDVASPITLSYLSKKDAIIKSSWMEGFKGKKKIFVLDTLNTKKFRIDAKKNIPELYRDNNTIRTSGIFKTNNPLHLSFLGSVENYNKSQLFYVPFVGWNNYDKFMIGGALYNDVFPVDQFDASLLPLYSINNKTIVGAGDIGYTFFPNIRTEKLRTIRIGLTAQRFSFYDSHNPLIHNKIEPEIKFNFRDLHSQWNFSHTIVLKFIYLNEEREDYSSRERKIISLNNNYIELTASTKSKNILYPYTIRYEQLHGSNFGKSQLIANFFIPYRSNVKGLSIRVYGGAFIYKTKNNLSPYKDYQLKLSATDGYQDIFYNETFLGRNEVFPNFMKQQIVLNEGGFRAWLPFGRTSEWIASTNLTSSIPGILPIKIFADFGTYSNAKNIFSKGQFLTYDAGIQLEIFPQVFEIYFPLVISKDIQYIYDLNSIDYWQRIRFTFNINKLNPVQYFRNLE